MKTTKLIILAANLELAAMLVVISACKSGGANSAAANTASGLQASAAKIEGSGGKLDAVLGSLNGIVNNPTNLPAQYATFTKSVKDFQSTAAEVDSKVTSMREKGNEYFKEWDAQAAQIKNEDIKARSETRKAEMQERFTKLKMSYTQLNDSYKPLISDLKDIQSALSLDLTTAGVASIKGAAEKANKDSVPFKKSVEDLAGQFKELGASMSSSTAAPAPSPAAAK